MSFQRTVKVNPTKLYQELGGLQVAQEEEEVAATYTAFRLESMDASTKMASVYYSITLENTAVPGYGYANFTYEDQGNILAEAEAYLQASFDVVALNPLPGS
ncbi:hypothetical protein ACRV44_005520 [Klebsiella pneumoniae]|uniref:hypothetical protein n=1 Tax=Klebsiella pneumoniae TaxID=573 RepID=UPI000E2A8BD8|nr:hypothetical protein [Klebsiella pneumoniae]MDK6836554.1 hypothetical protein [Klebsiella pneumoniae]SWA76402.1 Uncharacterised protein [Klebsiella pneumoniae]SWA87271.1 Uncharacterised protein [Klebsiella pneumoniae]SWB03246.1 Uncharacterised protein [Klebsiella pneumoniae]HBQ1585442.1 hypothetical protein [Klebsiella pneumoniae]